MRSNRTRPFTWVDGLILGAFAALGVTTAVAADEMFLSSMVFIASRSGPWEALPEWFGALELPAKRVQGGFLSFLIVLSPGIALVTFRRRVGRYRRELMKPGPAASATAAMVVMAYLAYTLAIVGYRDRWGDLSYRSFVPWGGLGVREYKTSVIGALLGVWSYLVLARSWKPHADWRDALGRWLGWCWLSNLAFDVLVPILWG